MTAPDLAGLCERLRKVESSRESVGHYDGHVTTNWHRNPDGPEAAAAIESLVSALDALSSASAGAINLAMSGRARRCDIRDILAGPTDAARTALEGASDDR